VNVDILVSGLTGLEAIGSVSLVLNWNPAILTGVSYTPDPDDDMDVANCEAEAVLGFPTEPSCDFSGGFGPGSLDLFFLANDELNFAALKALQGAAFRLATVTFEAIGPGLTLLTFDADGIFLGDPTGQLEIPSAAVSGDVCVGGDCELQPIPEPSTFALLGAGAAAVLARQVRRRRHAKP
jgi:hypothetical protein